MVIYCGGLLLIKVDSFDYIGEFYCYLIKKFFWGKIFVWSCGYLFLELFNIVMVRMGICLNYYVYVWIFLNGK